MICVQGYQRLIFQSKAPSEPSKAPTISSRDGTTIGVVVHLNTSRGCNSHHECDCRLRYVAPSDSRNLSCICGSGALSGEMGRALCGLANPTMSKNGRVGCFGSKAADLHPMTYCEHADTSPHGKSQAQRARRRARLRKSELSFRMRCSHVFCRRPQLVTRTSQQIVRGGNDGKVQRRVFLAKMEYLAHCSSGVPCPFEEVQNSAAGAQRSMSA